MNLNDAIIATNDIIFSPDLFGEWVEYWPGGDESKKFKVLATVDRDNLEGSNEVRGDGVSSLNANRGRVIRKSIVVDLPTTRVDAWKREVPLVVSESGRDRIIIEVQGQPFKLNVKRKIGADLAIQTVLCVQSTEIQAPHNRQRQG